MVWGILRLIKTVIRPLKGRQIEQNSNLSSGVSLPILLFAEQKLCTKVININVFGCFQSQYCLDTNMCSSINFFTSVLV